jgi:hypothetical protein
MTKNTPNAILSEISKSKDFLEIEQILKSRKKFNIFVATAISRWEIKHTKFLSYLLDPSKPHELGDSFLLNFLGKLFLANEFIKDLNTLNASIVSEKKIKISENNQSGQIDLIIEIPSIQTPQFNHVFIIENKIDSKQGSGQLEKYRKWSSKFYGDFAKSVHHYYLTIVEEDPEDDNWIPILYKDTVELAIGEILNDKKANSYLSKILENYLEILRIEDHCNFHASKIIDLYEEMNSTQGEFLKILQPLKKDFPNAVNFLEGYEARPRKVIKESFKELFDKQSGKYIGDSKYLIYLEDCSNDGQYLRIGFLSEKNSDVVKKISIAAKSNWLDSKCHLAMELVIKEPKKHQDKFKCNLKLTLGPLSEVYREYRQEIFNCIYFVVNKSENKQRNVINAFKTSNIGITHYKLKNQLSSRRDAENWIKEVLERISNDDIIAELNENIYQCFKKNGLV